MISKCAVSAPPEVSLYWSVDWPFAWTCSHEGIFSTNCWSVQSRIDWPGTSAGIWGLILSREMSTGIHINCKELAYSYVFIRRLCALIISCLRQSPRLILCRENEAVLFVKAIKHHHCALDIDLLYTADPCVCVCPLPLSPVLPSTDQCYWLLLYHCRHSCVDLLALQRSWSPSLAPSLRRRSFHGGPYCTDCSHFYWAQSCGRWLLW